MTACEPEFKKAVPTEYKGIVFRSKCEAIFCRALELRFGRSLIEYEPKRYETEDGWVPDFLIAYEDNKRQITMVFIEYKPDSATDTYKEKLLLRRKEAAQMLPGGCFILCCGSLWNKTRETFEVNRQTGEWENREKSLQIFRKIKEAGEFRFDLKHDKPAVIQPAKSVRVVWKINPHQIKKHHTIDL